MEKILQCNNVKMTIITTLGRIIKDLNKGNYIICADFNSSGGMITEDILFYDKKNKRVRFMLGQNWEEDFLNIYPVTGVITKNNDLEYFLKNTEKMNHFNIKNYNVICSVDPKYIRVINDNFKNVPNIFEI